MRTAAIISAALFFFLSGTALADVTISGTLERGTFVNCCSLGKSTKQPYTYLRLDQPNGYRRVQIIGMTLPTYGSHEIDVCKGDIHSAESGHYALRHYCELRYVQKDTPPKHTEASSLHQGPKSVPMSWMTCANIAYVYTMAAAEKGAGLSPQQVYRSRTMQSIIQGSHIQSAGIKQAINDVFFNASFDLPPEVLHNAVYESCENIRHGPRYKPLK